MFTLGVSLVHEQKYKEAVPLLQDAIIALPQIATIRKLLGISLFETGEIERGTSELTSYVKNSPEDAEGHYYLGVALRLRSHLEEAHSQFAEASRLQPNNPQYEAAAHPEATGSAKGAASDSESEDGSVSENVYTNKFFGFRYEFPKGWVSLSSGAARGMLEMGGAFLSTGDPTEQDVKKAATRNGHPLLYAVEGELRISRFRCNP
jgi:tetratricopeptide (TPR) repeat protein